MFWFEESYFVVFGYILLDDLDDENVLKLLISIKFGILLFNYNFVGLLM